MQMVEIDAQRLYIGQLVVWATVQAYLVGRSNKQLFWATKGYSYAIVFCTVLRGNGISKQRICAFASTEQN